MIMEKVAKQQICFKLCSNFSTFLPITVLLVLFSFFFFFSISKSSASLLTILIALLSTIFLVTLTKKKGSPDENIVQDNLQEWQLQPSLGDVPHTEVTKESETSHRHEQAEASFSLDSQSSKCSIMDKNFELNAHEHEQQADLQSDSSLPTDSKSSTGSIMGEGFDIDHSGHQNLCISDRLVSDNDDDDDDDGEEEEEEEDSLIEIKLPRSHFCGLHEDEEPMTKLESNLPIFLPESIFKQQDLLEFLAEINEMNEDENLIEIDISMGSTKCQDLRLKQELACFGDQCAPSD